MITKKINLIVWVTIISLLLILQCESNETGFHLSEFKNPPESAKIYTWWHWMNRAITREGISRDLEAMKEQGITGATIFNIYRLEGHEFEVPQVYFNSPEWYEMFRFALEKANQLGMEIGICNCDGYATAGGPWIKPEQSMKKCTWSTTLVKGGKKISVRLEQPEAIMNFYRDAFVFAFPAGENYRSAEEMPEVSINGTQDGSRLIDGSPLSYMNISMEEKVIYSFSKPERIEKISIHPQNTLYDFQADFDVEVSDNGKDFRKHAHISVNNRNQKTVWFFPPVTAKYFRVIPVRQNRSGRNSIAISEMELLGKDETPRYSPSLAWHLGKTSTLRFEKEEMDRIFDISPVQANAKTISPEEVIDLTGMMSENGILEWEAPEGDWLVTRFGFTTTGKFNSPPTDEGKGLEVDKMDTSALNLHFENFPRKLIDVADEMTGNTFKYFLVDSWECVFQNWTDHFPQEFEKRRGYSLFPYLPVLCGKVVESAEKTEAFLHDYRKTIADLIEDNFYKHFSDLCHRYDMELHAEPIYGDHNWHPPLDVLRTSKHLGVPMTEFWASTNDKSLVRYKPSSSSPNKPVHYVSVYNKPILLAEAFTGFAHYSETPWDLKPFGDRVFCEGVNRMVLHSYIHQPFEKKPGFTLGPFGSHFNRHNTWWRHFNKFSIYLARQQYILQQGNSKADVCYFMGDRMPYFHLQGSENRIYQSLPYGYNVDLINSDILINHMKIKNGKLTLPGEKEYQLLLLPDDSLIDLESLQRIEKLVSAGAIVVGPRPLKSLSLKNYNADSEQITKLAGKLWGETNGKATTENSYGKGKVIWNDNYKAILKKEGVLPDVENNDTKPSIFRFFHKMLGNQHVYLLFNQSEEEKQVEFLFKVQEATPHIYDPMNGEIRKCPAFRKEDSRMQVPLYFRPRQTYFVLFNEGIDDEHIVEIKQSGNQLFPLKNKADEAVNLPILNQINLNEIEILSGEGGNYTLVSSTGKEYEVSISQAETFVLNEFKGNIRFHENDSENVKKKNEDRTIDINSLISFTEFNDPFIKYFSGTATYNIHFDLPEGWLKPDYVYVLYPGEIGSSAEISLNEVLLDTVWEPDYPIRLRTLPKSGSNSLMVRTTNTWRNRIIGDLPDLNKPGKAWTTAHLEILSSYGKYYLEGDSELVPAGFRGPVRLIKYNSQIVKLE
ncbi:glycosyl hydrolase [Bacteroidota bacterium]